MDSFSSNSSVCMTLENSLSLLQLMSKVALTLFTAVSKFKEIEKGEEKMKTKRVGMEQFFNKMLLSTVESH